MRSPLVCWFRPPGPPAAAAFTRTSVTIGRFYRGRDEYRTDERQPCYLENVLSRHPKVFLERHAKESSAFSGKCVITEGVYTADRPGWGLTVAAACLWAEGEAHGARGTRWAEPEVIIGVLPRRCSVYAEARTAVSPDFTPLSDPYRTLYR
ncbi:hypothetical protein Bbelb_300550 [Branchiostoma belcheri]|nr:hypothetical protein Bbelb_300550 [Branchiostoma belcheri]